MLPTKATAIIRDTGAGLPDIGAALAIEDFAHRYDQRGVAPVYSVGEIIERYSPVKVKAEITLLAAERGSLDVHHCDVRVTFPSPIPRSNRSKYAAGDASKDAREYFRAMPVAVGKPLQSEIDEIEASDAAIREMDFDARRRARTRLKRDCDRHGFADEGFEHVDSRNPMGGVV